MSKRSNGIWNYEVRRLLGKGASARVYAGFDKTKKVEVAIKMIEKKLIISKHLRNRVWKEIWIHIKLEHPSIVELYEVFEDSNYVYLILELCHKGQMQHYLDSHSKALTDDEARVVMHQIIDGLKYLHYHGIIHRDLSLANLLLTKDMNVKIADFGMATKLEDPNQQHDTLCGTPNFMSLEIVSGKPYSQETDLWSLGVILYTCLVGKKPFEAKGVQATLKQVAQIKYELPNTLSPEARDLFTKIFCEAGDRISLQEMVCDGSISLMKIPRAHCQTTVSESTQRGSRIGIEAHPFMRVKSSAAMMSKKVAEMSIDSGCGTVSSTNHGSSGRCSNVSAPSRRTQPMPAFPLRQQIHREEDRSHTSIGSGAGSTRSLTYFSHSSSANVHSHSSSANVHSHSSSANFHSHSSCSNVSAPSRRTQPMPAFPLRQQIHREEDRSHTSIGSGTCSTRSLTYFSHNSSVNVHSHSSSANVHSHSSSVNVQSQYICKCSQSQFICKCSQSQFICKCSQTQFICKSSQTQFICKCSQSQFICKCSQTQFICECSQTQFICKCSQSQKIPMRVIVIPQVHQRKR